MNLGLKLKTVATVFMFALIGVGFFSTLNVYAEGAANSAELINAFEGLPGYCNGASCTTTTSNIQSSIVNTLLYLGGLIAVVMIIVGGIQMTTSAGNPATVTKAKRTILFSIVGLVLVILAYAIVNFVVTQV